ncbi:endo-1,4-beta-xylanase [Colletotrichum spaethianum]|uniref:Beta-xylanase n=1 Tax=Colletotrichum spaethianum TaxID=700344 RepID=A0AA37P010_9PEZI|nr:endo-1,4-beta-xylanase [Colletotrichum spaethianum]GKT45020.1 endo-1,4-beta-xylanase [Colletotrichum spaethianum]
MKVFLAIVLAPLAALATPLGIAPSSYHQSRSNGLVERQSPISIDELFKKRGKLYFGVSADNGIMQQGKTEAIIKANFGQVTPEYSMKWDATEPSRGNFSWGNSDFLVNWAQTNNKSIHGHTLLWHTALPTWVSNIRDEKVLSNVLQTHIRTVVGRYRGKIRAWNFTNKMVPQKDVVNEIFNDNGTLRNNTFLNVMGEAYVGVAFRAARAADPAAKLYINDYNLDNKGWGKVSALVNKVNQWVGQGIPIDGIGSQSHLAPNMSSNIEGALQSLATAHVSEIAITELDIDNAPPADYAAVVGACLNVPKCVGITTWGVSDKQSWKSAARPLLFDDSYNPKPAYNAIVRMLQRQ